MTTAHRAFGDIDNKAARTERSAGSLPRADVGKAGADGNEPQPLYASRKKIYPRKVSGTWRRVKWAALWVLLGLYYVGPWIRWDRGPNAPDQALLVDMAGRRAYFFGIEIWPQEVYYLTGLLILGAIGLFLATAWFGRVWCGFTCPQTVWTDLFMWVERKIEGDRNARMRLDNSAMSWTKAAKRLATHAAWLLIALATGGAWIMYFNDAPTVIADIFTGQASMAVYGFVLLFTGTTYLLAGWAREQVCIYMCPWPRFQSAMFDEDSLVVTYEDWRGEPRGGARKGQSFEGRGHCVDCGMCWQVCPTGVDIRKGQQMACIGCALCIDGCNSVMKRFGLPPNLITYDSYANQIARAKGQPTRIRLFRPRSLAYIALLAVVATIMIFSFATRERVKVNVLADRSPLYVQRAGGEIRNAYTFKILNMEREHKMYTLTTSGIPTAELTVVGYPADDANAALLPVEPDDVGTFRVFVTAPREHLSGAATDFRFVLTDRNSGEVVEHDTVFSGPLRMPECRG
jgi:cytochrome c oxidase accessory protein FixG